MSSPDPTTRPVALLEHSTERRMSPLGVGVWGYAVVGNNFAAAFDPDTHERKRIALLQVCLKTVVRWPYQHGNGFWLGGIIPPGQTGH